MAKGQTMLKGIMMIALVALVVAVPPFEKEGKDKRDEAAAKMKARAARPTPEEMERRGKVRVCACCRIARACQAPHRDADADMGQRPYLGLSARGAGPNDARRHAEPEKVVSDIRCNN